MARVEVPRRRSRSRGPRRRSSSKGDLRKAMRTSPTLSQENKFNLPPLRIGNSKTTTQADRRKAVICEGEREIGLADRLPFLSGGASSSAETKQFPALGSRTFEHNRKSSRECLLNDAGQNSYMRGFRVRNSSPRRTARNIFRHPAPRSPAFSDKPSSMSG